MKEQFIQLVARALETESFALVDIGCSGGIDPAWRSFEPRLRAIGVDPNEAECRRLTQQERNPEVNYLPAFVGRSADKPVAPYPTGFAIGLRTSFWRTLENRRQRLEQASAVEKVQHNAWSMTGLADANRPIVVPDLLADRGWRYLDYLKIDVDGADFEILQSFTDHFEALGILGVQLEVNFVGTADPNEHTFHNTDRFMRQQGYELMRLDNRTYSMAALPSPFATNFPAQSVGGRAFQGDAYYARDPVAVSGRDIGDPQLLKLAAILSAWGQPDGAAEILVSFRDQLAPLLDVDAALDVLAAQAQPAEEHPLSYREYMALYEEDAPLFYPPPPEQPRSPPRPTLFQRLQAAWYSVSDRTYIEKLMGDLKERRR